MTPAPTTLDDELVTFVQHQLPGLEDGTYRLTVSHRLAQSSGEAISTDVLQTSHDFAVLGDRFSLSNPAATVLAVFPPVNATGEFTAVLPHVVFTKPTYPWQRAPGDQPPAALPAAPQDTDADVPTWLALLLFDEDDVASFPSFSLEIEPATVGDLFPPGAVSTSSLGTGHSYFDTVTDAATAVEELEPGQAMTDAVQVLDVPLALFWQVAPTIDDLALTSHVRRVSLVNKPTGQGPDPGEPVGTFSIVVGTRLPQTNRKSRVYLVSLEGLSALLPDAQQGGPPAGTTLDGAGAVRLAVLKSWQFYSIGQPATFVDALLALNGRDAGSDAPAADTNLRLGYGGGNATVRDALAMGYVPLDQRMRTGESTVSWYRGPLVPYPAANAGLPFPIASPDQVTIFDPTTGMLDTSCAAAWTLGRLLALQDTGFSAALYTWKRGLSQQVVDAIEDQVLGQSFAEVAAAATGAPAASPRTAAPAGALLHQTMSFLAAAAERR